MRGFALPLARNPGLPPVGWCCPMEAERAQGQQREGWAWLQREWQAGQGAGQETLRQDKSEQPVFFSKNQRSRFCVCRSVVHRPGPWACWTPRQHPRQGGRHPAWYKCSGREGPRNSPVREALLGSAAGCCHRRGAPRAPAGLVQKPCQDD